MGPLISLILLMCALLPAFAHAGVIGDIIAFITGAPAQAEVTPDEGNMQTLELPRPAMNHDPGARGGGDITIVDDTALMPEEGPSGTLADIEKPKNSTVSLYVVRPGDTLGSIAKMFQVTPNTILWANDIPKGGVLKVGQKLVILPITSIKVTVKKGDTLASLAKKYGGDVTEIVNFNGIENGPLAVGDEIIIPNGELPETQAPSSPKKPVARASGPAGTSEQVGFYLRPIIGGTKTQGIHGYNGVDLASSMGTPVLASAAGDVVVARQGGWNGGYGNYIVIQHSNGSQTLYAHLSKVNVADGQSVARGEVIGALGNSGKSTGPHLHFEIRNGIRNPF